MFLSDISIKRPVFATMMMVALVVVGAVGFVRLSVDEYPDVTYPVIVAQTLYPGASPEVVEREVSKPLEEALNTTEGLKEITSTSTEGASLVRLQFNLGVDVQQMQPEVQGKIGRIRRQLPRDIEEPIVIRFDPNDRPIMSVALQSDARPMREITDLGREVIKPRIEAIPGVGGVTLVGGATREIRVELDPAALRAYGLSPISVVGALERENQEVPAGRVQRGDSERLVRITGRILDPMAFRDVTVAVRNGAPVRVRDVATVRDGVAEARSASFMGSDPALSLDVLKISGANTVDVADQVRVVVEELTRQLPDDIRLTIIRDDSAKIREALWDVELTLVLGAILTIVIIYFFLASWRSTVITGLTLPVAIISSFFAMWAFGFTLNTMTLLALSLSIGLLIDDAIVVRENIVRHVAMGKDHYTAAREGTSEIGLAVFATTLAVIAVFIPVAFMGGMIGKIFFQFGVTVAFAVSVSLFVSFTLDPMLSSIWHDPEAEHHNAEARAKSGPIRRVALAFDGWFERMAERYPPLLHRALGHRWLVLGGGGVSVVLALFIAAKLGFTWMPDYDAGEFNISYRVPPGARVEYTVGKGMALDSIVRDVPEVEFTYLTVGSGFRGTVTTGQLFVKLKPSHDRKRSMADVQNAIRPQLRNVSGTRASIDGTRSIFGGFRQPIIVNVQGPEPNRLKLIAAQVNEIMRDVPGMAEPFSSDEGDIPQLDVRVDRQQAWAAGLGIGAIAGTLQPLFTGTRATRWQDEQGYSHDVRVVYPDSLRASAEDVANIPVAAAAVDARGLPVAIPLAQVADVRAGVGPQQIERRQLERQISISAGVLPGAAVGDVAAATQAALDSLVLPAGYRTVFTGDVQNLNETKGFVLEAILLAIVFIYLILASLFGSFLQPLAIMFSLPLSLLGVSLALWWTKGTINVMSMIGIIMLMGLVTKNGILLIDFVNQARGEGKDRLTAILEAGRIRLRPIIMTTAAMIFGMLPLALAIGEGAEQRAPMARAVIGGLITSTILTLFVVPVVYTILDDLSSGWARRRQARATSEARPAPEAPALAHGEAGNPA
ncbi:MAG: efflux RND transporter permease subunit [Gemmatimonadaceae bacterium]|nr:efflux RND transporter permease subunit [Gemmatimonadaceae bacterium]MCW5827055.1 efflux RND transporter permease subunit [Gemmatimonadaceae bacterium]